ncbi:uncharacterized protein BYT42DRAFT_530399 [Radiomyces spectabilis]|uniref:uncharacterized protein n=1 Tax=Radiomyces spectabilis TaxID=64574 RepID=UPI00221EFFA4|nr:uncharacterized protein BYT42DRAFT_530399 [Radiomyces spectabilis]KAI8385036.1 hypothetical protein BYT42DRAFT_530399 [Radiomyces spectabilis]
MDSVLLWDENKVNKWLASIGYSSFEKTFKEQGITGDVLVHLDHDSLKDLSIHSVGQRLDILKNIYHLKAMCRVPLNEWDYVPPSVLYENDWLGHNGLADYRKIEMAFQERDEHVRRLTEDLLRISSEMDRLRDDLFRFSKEKKPSSSSSSSQSSGQKYHLTNAGSSSKAGHMLTPPTSTLSSSHPTLDYFNPANDEPSKPTPHVTINDGGAIKVYGEKISNSSKVDLESSKNVRLLLDDPCSKVITSALKKYNVNDDWQQYALWIQFGSPDNIQEQALGYDEKPLRISQKLKESNQNPVFVLKHVKDNKPFIPPSGSNSPQNVLPYSWRSDHYPKTAITAGRVGYEVVVPVISSSISTPTPSTTPIPSSPSAKRSGTIHAPAPDKLLSELGLESGVATAIYSIMMEHDKNP